MTTPLFIMCLLAVLAPNNGKVADVIITPMRIASGGSFEIHLTASDSDGLMGGFVLNLTNDQANFKKDIEYLWSDMHGDREGDIKMIVGPGENSRFGDAEITDQWPVGSTTILRVIVRDVNDDRTAVDIGEVEVVEKAMLTAAPAKPVKPAKLIKLVMPARGGTGRLNATFDDNTLGGAVELRYINRHSDENLNDRLISKIAGGVLTLGARFDTAAAAGAGDYVPLEWRDINASLTESPVLEMRFRASDKKAAILVQGTYEFADGSRQTPYFYATFDKPGEWVTQSNRLVGDASLPKLWTPRKLVSLNIWVMGDHPVTVDFDYVRLRALNDKEREREKQWLALMTDYDPGQPKILREFFPFGVYAAPPDTSSSNMIRHRQSFNIISRHHLNFMKAGGVQRRGGKPIKNPTSVVMPIIAAAKDAGIRIGLRMRYATYQFTKHGTKGIQDWARPFLNMVGNHREVVCYDMGDERPLSALYDIVAAIAVFNKMDPTRPSALTFWDLTSVRGFDPYVAVNVADIYPLQQSSKDDAASMYDFCRGVARDTNNKPQWIILQSFGSAPWRENRNYITPTTTQLRLMTWASLAGGARGLIYYSFSYDRYKMLADQWGNPNELLAELSELGQTIIPIGHRLLDAEVDFESPITANNDKLLVGVLLASQRDVRYVIVVNKDLNNKQGGQLVKSAATMLDLHSLTNVADGKIAPLKPGGGRVYMIGTPEQFKTEVAALRQLRSAETQRAKTPDRTLARIYGNKLPAALIIKNQLDAIGQLMGTVEPAMYEDNPDKKVVELMSDYRNRYWSVHQPWALMYDLLLSGTLPSAIQLNQMAANATKVVTDVRKVLGNHRMYPARSGH